MAAMLIAAGIDWLEGLLPLLFVGFWILSQIMAVFRRVRGSDVVIERRPPQQPPEGQVFRRDRPLDRTELERQVEEFLRSRLAQRPQPAETPAAEMTRRGQQKMRESRGPRPAPAREAAPRETDVARHVQDAFGHELAHLETSLTEATPEQPARTAPATTAATLAAMLRNPQSIRRVILLREVLERPTERW